jgi:hypothetical protein
VCSWFAFLTIYLSYLSLNCKIYPVRLDRTIARTRSQQISDPFPNHNFDSARDSKEGNSGRTNAFTPLSIVIETISLSSTGSPLVQSCQETLVVPTALLAPIPTFPTKSNRIDIHRRQTRSHSFIAVNNSSNRHLSPVNNQTVNSKSLVSIVLSFTSTIVASISRKGPPFRTHQRLDIKICFHARTDPADSI